MPELHHYEENYTVWNTPRISIIVPASYHYWMTGNLWHLHNRVSWSGGSVLLHWCIMHVQCAYKTGMYESTLFVLSCFLKTLNICD